VLMKDVSTGATQHKPCFTSSGSVLGRTFRDFLARMREWSEAQNTQPTTFRYRFHERDTLLRVNFEAQDQAKAFAEAFGGVILA